MTLEVAIGHRLGAFTLDARFQTGSGVTALCGRSGAGKTTIVRALAGLMRPNRGFIRIDDQILLDTERRVNVPPHKRRLGYVFQDARLFPHLSVRSNLLYGRFFTPKGDRTTRLDDVVEILGIGHLLKRRPTALSGGERQRVAIGRALMADPRILLMDEPLASLDRGRKDEVLPFIERLRDEVRVPIVYVSHSVEEVARLATEIVFLDAGRVGACGPAADLLRRRDLFPDFREHETENLFACTLAMHDGASRLSELRSSIGRLRVPLVAARLGQALKVRIRGADIMLATRPPEEVSALNVLQGEVRAAVALDERTAEIALRCGSGELVVHMPLAAAIRLGITSGMTAYALIQRLEVEVAPEAV